MAVLLTASAPKVLVGEALPPEFAVAGQPAPINSLAFARRGALPGRPSYLETIKYIDDGVRYIDALSQFFISPAGEMCFRTRANYPQIYYNAYYRHWCIYPQSIDRVSVLEIETGLMGVELWCMRAYPQCAHSLETGEIANRISAPAIDYRQERAALQNLIYLMGGNVRFSQPQLSGE